MKTVTRIAGVLIVLVALGAVFMWRPADDPAVTAAGRGMAGGAVQANGAAQTDGVQGPFIGQPAQAGLSPAVRDLPDAQIEPELEREINPRASLATLPNDLPPLDPDWRDPLAANSLNESGLTPGLLFEFAGMSLSSGGNGTPPDTVGDVGPNHYVQMVNTSFSIYDKSGNLLDGPHLINQLWSSQSNRCAQQNAGDPVVLYDNLADRWLLSQFTGNNDICVAISQTSNPLGSYHLYMFTNSSFPDYFKFGVWPDGYYIGANQSGANVHVLERDKMLNGQTADRVSFAQSGVNVHSLLLPSDLDGPTAPPAGAPNVFHRFIDGNLFGGVDRLELFEFHVDWNNMNNSTWSGPSQIPTAAFASLCNFSFSCIVQPNTSQKLDSITEWPMWRFAYRNFGTHEVLLSNHAVNVGGNQAGVRWFELRKSGGSWSLYQEGTLAPDSHSRWMGSMAMDQDGNIALGYSVSSSSVFPSIRYTTRLAGDPLGTMQTEETLWAGGGSQTSLNRWGDYSALSIDPADDCTFWYTNEYYSSTAGNNWKTRIGVFKIPSCGSGPEPTPTNTPVTPTNTPVSPTPTNTPDGPTPTPSPIVQVCSVSPAAIPDNGSGQSLIVVSESGEIDDLDVNLEVQHSYIGDLVFTLTHQETGTSATLVDRPLYPERGSGCPGENILTVLSDEAALPIEDQCDRFSDPAIQGVFSPNGALSSFDGEQLTGTWVLDFSDVASGDSGTVTEWCLSALPVGGPDPTPTNTPESPTPTDTPEGPTPTATNTPDAPSPTPVTSLQACTGPASIPNIGDNESLLFIAQNGTIEDLDVSLDVAHTYLGDLIFTLTHLETGSSMTLVERPLHPERGSGCPGSNMAANLSDEAALPVEDECDRFSDPAINGTFSPNGLLSTFDGESISGNWVLGISDVASGDSGTVTEWCVSADLAGGPAPTPTATPDPSGEMLYLSSSANSSVGGVAFNDEDILAYDPNGDSWSMLFDGSDVGIGVDLTAFTIMDDESILMSFEAAASVPGVGSVPVNDVVRFTPMTLGDSTTGSFTLYFDGSDVGLAAADEGIDALAMLPGGDLLLSVSNRASLPGNLRAQSEDLLRFTPSSLGSSTSGSWSLYFDGSDVGLANSTDENVWGSWLAAGGDIYLTTQGAFAVPGASGDGSDIFVCAPSSTGSNTGCTFSSYWDGSADGFSFVVDAFAVVP